MVVPTTRRAVVFNAPGEVVVQEEPLFPPGPGQVLVKTLLSAISSGTEMLVYRGQFPGNIPVDASIPGLAKGFSYPLKYGYSLVGEVVETGPEVDPTWLDKRVFTFHPHEDLFTITPQELLPLPEGTPLELAIFLPNMETAVNFLLDGSPVIGEKVVVFGQGIVGLLTTVLLGRFPLSYLVTLDRYPIRRKLSLELGAKASLDPTHPGLAEELDALLGSGADLVFELSGSPEVLNQAIQITGYSGRTVVGSWYGDKRAEINLGGRYHRDRIRLISSQVSSLDPSLLGRWDKTRRLQVAWEALEFIQPARLITHRFPVQEAANAYHLLDEEPGSTLQVVLEY